MFITASTNIRHMCLYWVSLINSTYFHTNIDLFRWVTFRQHFQPTPSVRSFLPQVGHMTDSSLLSWQAQTNNVCRWVRNVKLSVKQFPLSRVCSNVGIIRSVNDVWLVKSLAVSHAAIRVDEAEVIPWHQAAASDGAEMGHAPPSLGGCDIALYKALLTSTEIPVYHSTVDCTN